MRDNNSADLELEAFRFVSGELNRAEAAEFERRLADEQTVREAVCRVVAVTEKLTLVGSQCDDAGSTTTVALAAQPRLGRVASAISWMAVGALVASAVFVVADWNSRWHDQRLVDETEASGLTPITAPAPPLEPMLVDGLVWSQISATTRWNKEFDWIAESSGLDATLPQFALPVPQPDSLFEVLNSQGEAQ